MTQPKHLSISFFVIILLLVGCGGPNKIVKLHAKWGKPDQTWKTSTTVKDRTCKSYYYCKNAVVLGCGEKVSDKISFKKTACEQVNASLNVALAQDLKDYFESLPFEKQASILERDVKVGSLAADAYIAYPFFYDEIENDRSNKVMILSDGEKYLYEIEQDSANKILSIHTTKNKKEIKRQKELARKETAQKPKKPSFFSQLAGSAFKAATLAVAAGAMAQAKQDMNKSGQTEQTTTSTQNYTETKTYKSESELSNWGKTCSQYNTNACGYGFCYTESGSYGYCTRYCKSNSDCKSGFQCGNSKGFGKICLK